MNFIDTMRVMQADYSASWTHFWAWCAVAGFAVLALFGACYLLKRYVDRMGRGGRFAQVAGIVVTAALVGYAGHKWRFQFANGIRDNGSYATNDLAVASWEVNSPIYLDGYVLKAQYRNLTITNELGECIDVWHELEDGEVGRLTKAWTVPDATNCIVSVWPQYVAPVIVHTNGVYHLSGIMREMEDTQKYVSPGVEIRVNLANGEVMTITPTNAPPGNSLMLLTPKPTQE